MTLILNNKELKSGDIVEDGDNFDGGVIMHIDYTIKSVYMYDGSEGWECNEENENMGEMKFV
jgi:hypothetical protein